MPLPISPPISVVIPAFNVASYLREAIASVRTEVGDCAEIIVVDDGSSDDTAAIAEAHADSVTCIRRIRRRGAGAARNQGVAAARGRYLAFLDADDRWPAGRLRALASALHGAPAPRRPGLPSAMCGSFFVPRWIRRLVAGCAAPRGSRPAIALVRC